MEAAAPLGKDSNRPDMSEVMTKESLKVIKNLFQTNCKTLSLQLILGINRAR